MQDQGKRLLLAVALALGVLLLYNMIFPSKPQDDVKPTTGSGSAVVAPTKLEHAGDQPSVATPTNPTTPPTTNPANPTTPPTTNPTNPAPPVESPCVPKLATLQFTSIKATFSTCGGSLVGWQLTDKRYAEDLTTNRGELIPAEPEAGAFQFNYRNDADQPLIPAHAEWVESCRTSSTICFKYSGPTIDITKTFTIEPETYMVVLEVSARSHVVGSYHSVFTSYGFQDPKTDSDSGSSRVQPRIWQSATLRADGGGIATTSGIELRKDGARREFPIQWTGFEHPYLLVAFAPKLEQGDEYRKRTHAILPEGMMRTDIELGKSEAFTENGPTSTRKLVGYLGPKNYEQLDHADEVAGFTTGFKDTIDFGHFPLLGFSLSFIGKPLLWLLAKFYGIVGNWGISIILLTLCVKLATLYWTTKSMRSMKGMAAVAPQMKILQEKYKEDRPRLQAETMALYKQHNVNPLSGCLPIFLQIPIWSALYIMLSATGELYLEPFVPGWINDLTNTDPLHILPVLLVVTMFVQARLSPSTSTDRTQKFIQYGMPLMFGVMSFFFPSGLTLYIFTNTVLSAVHSLYMNKYDKKSLAIAAQIKKNAAEAAAKAAKGPDKPAAKPSKVIDVKANEPSDDDRDDDADSANDAPAIAAASSSPARARPRRKKRRR